MATADGVEMVRYTGTEPLRLEDEQGGLRGYFSPGAQLAIGEHNRDLAEELLARGDFEDALGEAVEGQATATAEATATGDR